MGDAMDEAGLGGPVAALPRGAMDRLPDACRRRRAMTSALLSTFEAWGYEPVSTPAIEYFEVLARGLSAADRRGCIRFIAPGSGELVTLRADVTPQIARMLAQRWGGELADDVVHRFSYAAELLRQPTTAREQTEVHQVGVELIGDGDAAADAELLTLADASLRAVGVARFRIDLAHVRVARGLLAALELPPAALADAHARLARKDRDGLDAMLDGWERPAALRRATVALCDLFGPPAEVMPRARAVLGGLGVDDALDQLEAVTGHLTRGAAEVQARLTLDLGEARGFDYYSGLRVRGWAEGVKQPIVRGGRYDGLTRRYGVSRPATGFALELDAVEQALRAQGVTVAGAEAPPAHLVALAPGEGDAPARARAQEQARRARNRGLRAWVQPSITLSRAQALADEAGATTMTFVEDGAIARWVRRSQGWIRTEETT